MIRRVNPYSVFRIYCGKCRIDLPYGWHEGIVHFPAIRKEDNTVHIYFKCPLDSTYSIYTVCPKCHHNFHISKGLRIINENNLQKLVLVCPKCGWKEALDYFYPDVIIIVYSSRYSSMYFKLQKPLMYFLSRGIVATMRNRRFPTGATILVNSRYPAKVKDVVETTKDNIERFSSISGFTTADEWVCAAMSIHRGKLPKWIVIIERISGDKKP